MSQPEPTPTTSALDIKFGYGQHGANVRHFIPSPEHIAQACREIREKGYTDHHGVWHAPWGQVEVCERRGGRSG